ncbi:MAG TPA: hypothetical protein VGG20_03280 [Thermoanaerobaculia bacterium]
MSDDTAGRFLEGFAGEQTDGFTVQGQTSRMLLHYAFLLVLMILYGIDAGRLGRSEQQGDLAATVEVSCDRARVPDRSRADLAGILSPTHEILRMTHEVCRMTRELLRVSHELHRKIRTLPSGFDAILRMTRLFHTNHLLKLRLLRPISGDESRLHGLLAEIIRILSEVCI